MGTASLDKAGRIGGVGFRLLGEVCVVADGAGRVDLGTPKQRVVFAALVLAAGHPMSVDALTLAVWGEHPPANCRNVLATYVSRLRQVLARVPGTPRIANQARGYVLACDPATVDVFRFRAAIAHARQALDDGDDELVVGRLSEALAQWSGEALAGLPGDWSVQTAVHLERERRDARAIRIDALLRAGRGADVLDELYRLVDSFPLDEQFATQLMRALSAVGRGADALAAYHTLRDRLAAELGVEPSAPAQEAYLMVLRSNGPPEVPVAIQLHRRPLTVQRGPRAVRPGYVQARQGISSPQLRCLREQRRGGPLVNGCAGAGNQGAEPVQVNRFPVGLQDVTVRPAYQLGALSVRLGSSTGVAQQPAQVADVDVQRVPVLLGRLVPDPLYQHVGRYDQSGVDGQRGQYHQPLPRPDLEPAAAGIHLHRSQQPKLQHPRSIAWRPSRLWSAGDATTRAAAVAHRAAGVVFVSQDRRSADASASVRAGVPPPPRPAVDD